MRAGVFDSGVGGLSVLKGLLDNGLFEEIIYYGDTARVPYGTKDKETIIRFSLEALDFFSQFDLDIIIIACNTVSAYALDALRQKAKIPIVGVIEAGIRAVENKVLDKDSNILVIGTKATINSKIYSNLLNLNGYKNVTELATSLFVPLVEEGVFEGKLLQECYEFYFKNIGFSPDALILGCTHFPLLSNSLKQYFGEKTILIHSGEAIAQHLRDDLGFEKRFLTTNVEYFASQDPKDIISTAKIWL